MLEAFPGFELKTVANGEDGLSAIERFRPGVVLLDVDLGDGLGGFEVCRRINQLSDPPPVIFLTSRDRARDMKEGLDAGAAAYLTKPFSPIELIESLQSVGKAD
jgi:DNA-binding response OmpR family regulator